MGFFTGLQLQCSLNLFCRSNFSTNPSLGSTLGLGSELSRDTFSKMLVYSSSILYFGGIASTSSSVCLTASMTILSTVSRNDCGTASPSGCPTPFWSQGRVFLSVFSPGWNDNHNSVQRGWGVPWLQKIRSAQE